MEKHECETKIGPIWEINFNKYGETFCKKCGMPLKEEQINVRVMNDIKRRLSDE